MSIKRAELPTYAHLAGCPSSIDPARGRVETYLVDRPEGQGGGRVRVTRCTDCGADLHELEEADHARG